MPVTHESRTFLMVFSGCIAQAKGNSYDYFISSLQRDNIHE